MTASDDDSIAVLGAGIVGVCCALHLQQRGWTVTLIDRKSPGSETSYGNAGIISRVFLPANSQRLWKQIPGLLSSKSSKLRVSPGHIARHPGWLLRYLGAATRKSYLARARTLTAITSTSIDDHRQLMEDAGILHRLRDTGWLHLYRSEKSFDTVAADRSLYRELGGTVEELDGNAIHELEPHIGPVFPRAGLISSSASVDSPGAVTKAYAALFQQRGGKILRRAVEAIEPVSDGYSLRSGDDGETGRSLFARQAVVAAGAWSTDLLRPLGYHLPLGVERGYHCHFAARGNATLSRPCYDIDIGYLATPMEQGIRVTSGVELAPRDAPPTPIQLQQLLPKAKAAFPIADALDETPWLGCRPSMPDAIPVIGEAPRHKGLWFAFGHGHFGFGTSASTGRLIAAAISGENQQEDLSGFSASRFL